MEENWARNPPKGCTNNPRKSWDFNDKQPQVVSLADFWCINSISLMKSYRGAAKYKDSPPTHRDDQCVDRPAPEMVLVRDYGRGDLAQKLGVFKWRYGGEGVGYQVTH